MSERPDRREIVKALDTLVARGVFSVVRKPRPGCGGLTWEFVVGITEGPEREVRYISVGPRGETGRSSRG